jgi:hypothetical protein
MLTYSHTTQIAAAPDAVWSVLTNAGGYPAWDPNMIRLDGTIEAGGKVTAHTRLSPRAFPVRITTFEPARKMVWSGGLPLGLFKGVRTFELRPKDGGTEFTVREEFGGPLLGMFKGTIPDMNKPFADFAAGLKATAERL